MRILITGAAGFIGSHLARHFAAAGHDVIGADRFSYAGKARRLRDHLQHISLLVGDLAQGDLPYRCTEAAPDVVLHTAAETHVDRSIMDPTTFLVANPMGTSKLLDAFAKATCAARPRFIVYSTDEVYGPSRSPADLRFEDDPYNPSNAYSASKVAVEAVCNAFKVTHGLDIVVVRPCNVYGRGQHPEKAIPKWTSQLAAGAPATIYNAGDGFRDWMHTHDHCRAIEAIITDDPLFPGWQRARSFGSINLARGDFRTDMQVYEALVRTLGIVGSHKLVAGRPGHDHGYAMHGTRLHSLGWRPSISFDEGLRDLVDWMREQPDFWQHDVVQRASYDEWLAGAF